MGAGAAGGRVLWFVQAADRVWGPYSEERIAGFVEEGRVGADTPLARTREGPFAPAAHQARLRRLFAAPEPEAELHAVEAQEDRPQPGPSRAPERPLLVWTALKSQRQDRFETVIGAYGPFLRLHDGLWLVRARMGPSALRNALTRRLNGSDALMVLAAPITAAAWFNLDGETDRTLRQLWGEESEGESSGSAG